MKILLMYGVCFFAEGSCGSYECKSGTKNSWAINNQDLSVLEKMQVYFRKMRTSLWLEDFRYND